MNNVLFLRVAVIHSYPPVLKDVLPNLHRRLYDKTMTSLQLNDPAFLELCKVSSRIIGNVQLQKYIVLEAGGLR